jgi:hypothetical protein
MQHSDSFGDLADEGHVVLDDNDGVSSLQVLDDQRGLVRLDLGHTGGGFVKQNDLGVLGDQKPELEPLGLAMTEIGRDLVGLLG